MVNTILAMVIKMKDAQTQERHDLWWPLKGNGKAYLIAFDLPGS